MHQNQSRLLNQKTTSLYLTVFHCTTPPTQSAFLAPTCGIPCAPEICASEIFRARSQLNTYAVAASPSPVFPNAAGEQITILLVEDERFVREAAAQILESAGYRVVKARNATEARRAFHQAEAQVHVLVTDVVLPHTSGCELARELAAAQPALKTIFMSGYPAFISASASAYSATNGSGVFFLHKPFTVVSLLRQIKAALGEEEAVTPTARAACTG